MAAIAVAAPIEAFPDFDIPGFDIARMDTRSDQQHNPPPPPAQVQNSSRRLFISNPGTADTPSSPSDAHLPSGNDARTPSPVASAPPILAAGPPPSSSPLPHPEMHHHAESFPLLSPALPLITRLNRRRQVFWHTFSFGSSSAPKVPGRSRRRSSATTGPTFIKTYESRPKLPVRVYIPPPQTSQPGPLPLYVHVAPPEFLATDRGRERRAEERFCSRLTKGHGVCVASITVRPPPRWLFPTQIYDVIAIIQDMLASMALPIDRRRVAVGGFGMGASVALGVAQSSEMRGVLSGVLAICPIVDWTLSVDEKMDSIGLAEEVGDATKTEIPSDGNGNRQRRGSAGRRNELRMARLHKLIDYAYVPPRLELSDPLLSPAFAARSSMPRHVCLIGAQRDILCAETEKMAVRLAVDEAGETVGEEDLWIRGGIKWEKVLDWGHEFTYREEKGERERDRQVVLDDLFDRTGDWLWARVFA